MKNPETMGRGAEVRIVIAAHKAYQMPEDPMYIPLQVGTAVRGPGKKNRLKGYAWDDTGENISWLNPSFCELTGLYWAWKNLSADYIGLAHYRRHFSLSKKQDRWESILTYEELVPYLGRVRIFTPAARKYYIESLYSHYAHTHYAHHLDAAREVLRTMYPDYLPDFERVMKQTSGYMFNMMIMERELFGRYCEWLFSVLFALREQLGEQPGLSAFQARLYGRVSELLFNVWLNRMLGKGEVSREQVMEVPLVHMEKVNWRKKGTAFLKARFFGKRYEGSF